MARTDGSDKDATKREQQVKDAKSDDQSYARQVISTVGGMKRPAVSKWRPGVAGTTPDGTRFVVYGRHIRSGGERAWRTNNPGNITFGAFARANGAIGRDGQYAIFPDQRTGRRALIALLRAPAYVQMSVLEVLFRHASNVRGNTEVRARSIRSRLNPDASVGSLNEPELLRLSLAITLTDQPMLHRVDQL